VACTEDPLTGLDGADAPGTAPETVELEIPASDLPLWRDTTYSGYAIATGSSWRVVADSSDLKARVLGRVETLPDSITVGERTLIVQDFREGRFRLVFDTLETVLPAGGAELAVHGLARGFDAREATWTEARAGEAWTTPGGDLGPRLGSARLDALADTVFVPLDVPTDSLLKAWRGADGETGFAIAAEGSGTVLRVRAVAVLAEATIANVDTVVDVVRTPIPSTVIFSPETPAAGQALRLGGLPASRIYMRFRLPESVGKVDLRGATVNRASIVLRPEPTEPEPFRLADPLTVSPFRLLGDPFEYGEKTPIGGIVGGLVVLNPDSLATGKELVVPMTGLVQLWSAANPDSIAELDVGIEALPEGRDPGFWSFGSVTSAPALRPSVRLLVTPRAAFVLP
jgi:hypothetical protein